jgi:polyhydroxyalkanoate synthesis regulator phasin
MSSISGVSGSNNWYSENSSQAQAQTKKINSTLDSLVSSGTISQDQETSIESALSSAFQSNSTQASSAPAAAQTSPLDSLVANGTLTQDQANAVDSALRSGHHHHHAQPDLNSSISNALDNLTSNGTITQDQSDAIQKSLQAIFNSQQDENGTSNLTAAAGTFSVTA